MIYQLGKKAKTAQYHLSVLSTADKNKVLSYLIKELENNTSLIIAANQLDLQAGQKNQLSDALLDRLKLTEQRILDMTKEISKVIELPDPIGQVLSDVKLESGLHLMKKRVPLGVIGVIYESRPNVTIDITSLCLKTGNCAILRGGKEAQHTNALLIKLIQNSLEKANLPKECIQLIEDPNRQNILELLKLDQFVDMIIPRGGSQLQDLCKREATIPVIIGGIGVCHLYVDESANVDKTIPLIVNAKTQRPSTCNSLETLLIHRNKLDELLPRLATAIKEHQIVPHVHSELADKLAQFNVESLPLKEEELREEWLCNHLNILIVEDMDAAIAHIREYGTKHSEGIITESNANAQKFINSIDAAALYINASTRFTDGAQFGLGAEVAVSTQKLHARGPMGLEALTTYKWIGEGDYLTRS